MSVYSRAVAPLHLVCDFEGCATEFHPKRLIEDADRLRRAARRHGWQAAKPAPDGRMVYWGEDRCPAHLITTTAENR